MLYNRADMELELEIIEIASQSLSRKVAAGEISGFECLRIERELDYRRRQAKGKLLRTQSIVSDIRSAKHRLQEANNSQAQSAWKRQAVALAEAAVKKALAATRFNQSPYRRKEQDGGEVSLIAT